MSSPPPRAVALLQLGVERVAESVADQVEPKDHHEDRHARECADPRRTQDVFPSGGEHCAPFGSWRLRAEAEGAESGGGDYRLPNAEGGLDDDRPQHIRQDVPKDNPQVGAAADPTRT